jgi:hypothetical protein
MATYIQGQQDYITQVQPNAPNLQFDAQILSLKQNKYDANHKKVSDLYGSLLNADMTRVDNNLQRNEFFKIINSDIKKMGSFDFSLDANVTAAASIFESIYTNENIVKDMVWTKNFNNEVTRMNGFKNCLDEKQCGGTFWEEGEKYMGYKKKEFENASVGEALSTENVRFIPNKSVMKEAIKLAKEADLNVTIDKKQGNYIVRTKNGELITTPLTLLFKETIGSDPAFADKFLAEAYVKRNDWVYNKVAMGEFSTAQEGQMAYLSKIDRDNKAELKTQAQSLNQDLNVLNQSVAYYKSRYEKGQFKDGSDEYFKYENLVQLQQNAQAAANYTQNLRQISAANNKNAAMEVLLNNADQQTAYVNLNKELQTAVNTLAFKDYESTMTADEFAILNTKYEQDRKLNAQKHSFAIAQDNNKAAHARSLARLNSTLKKSEDKAKDEKDKAKNAAAQLEKLGALSQAQTAHNNWRTQRQMNIEDLYKRNNNGETFPEETLRNAAGAKGDDLRKKVQKATDEYNQTEQQLKEAVNIKSYDAGLEPPNPENMSIRELDWFVKNDKPEQATEYLAAAARDIKNNYRKKGSTKDLTDQEAIALAEQAFNNEDNLGESSIVFNLTNDGIIETIKK